MDSRALNSGRLRFGDFISNVSLVVSVVCNSKSKDFFKKKLESIVQLFLILIICPNHCPCSFRAVTYRELPSVMISETNCYPASPDAGLDWPTNREGIVSLSLGNRLSARAAGAYRAQGRG